MPREGLHYTAWICVEGGSWRRVATAPSEDEAWRLLLLEPLPPVALERIRLEVTRGDKLPPGKTRKKAAESA